MLSTASLVKFDDCVLTDGNMNVTTTIKKSIKWEDLPSTAAQHAFGPPDIEIKKEKPDPKLAEIRAELGREIADPDHWFASDFNVWKIAAFVGLGICISLVLILLTILCQGRKSRRDKAIKEETFEDILMKTAAIKDFPIPKNVKQNKWFLGVTGYYRKFIPKYGIIEAPLHKLCSQKVPFVWIESIHTAAFMKLKEALMTPPVLIFPDLTQEFILTETGFGAVLSQVREGKDRPIAYASRALNDVEKRRHANSAIEKEMLAIVWGVKHFRQFLYGRHFTIYTDHEPLKAFKTMNNQNTDEDQNTDEV